jgi:Tol biopolymer transport system component
LGGTERKLTDFHPIDSGFTRPSIAWSPKGEWLAVGEAESASENGIFLIPSRGGEKRRLVNSATAELWFGYPTFSPDGLWLAYAGCKGERACDLYLQELSKDYLPQGSARQITKQGATIEGIAWAPDGRSLVYSAYTDITSFCPMWRVTVSGNEQPELLSWAGDYVFSPSASKDGNRLAFSRSIAGNSDLWKFQEGSSPAKFSVSTSSETDPQFSPDGRLVAYSANRAGTGAELWVARNDGTGALRITEGNGRSLGGPRWSPDGKRIVYNAQVQDGRWHIFSIDAVGGQPVILTNTPYDENLPSYSHDGKLIYFCSNRTGRYEIYRMPADGGETRQITENGGFDALESWDGKTLYYTKGWYTGIYSRPIAGGPEKPFLESVSLAVGSFMVFEKGIYYVLKDGHYRSDPLEFRFLDFSTGKSRVLTKFNASNGQGLTVSPDGKTMLYRVNTGGNSVLMQVENFR